MVSCKQCNTNNSIDSAFCKKCGATLDAAEIAIAQEKLTAMIADGNRLFVDGRTDDALMVAETAIASDPTSAAAISLKGMCLERSGHMAEALECFERVVELQPDSTLDKLKVNDLKNLLVVQKFEDQRRPDRRVALIGSAAAVLLVISGGALFATVNAKESPNNSKLVAMNETSNQPITFDQVLPKGGAPTQQQQSLNQLPTADTSVLGGSRLDGTGPIQQSRRENMNLPKYNEGGLPNPEGGINGQIGPLKVQVDPSQLPKLPDTNSGQRQANTSDPEPGVLDNRGGGSVSEPQSEPPKNDPGIIEIEVSKGSGSKPSSGGGEVAPTGNGRQALLATARSQMMSNNYSAAANTYERALRAGADPGSTNQRLGQCYAQLGRNGDAVAAYTRAAGAFEKSGNSQAAEACRQAIKVLGG